MNPEYRQWIWIIIDNVRTGVKLDEYGVLTSIDIIAQRTQLQSGEYTAIGYFILGHTRQPDRAYPYFIRAMQTATPQDPLAIETIGEMQKQGRMERSEEHTSELQSLMRISYAVFCLKKKNTKRHRQRTRKHAIHNQL